MRHLIEVGIPFSLFSAALIVWLKAKPKEGEMKEIKGIKLIQKTKYRWDVMSNSGHMMVEGIYFPSAYKATEWAKIYVSSWTPSLRYELVLKEGA